MQNFIICLIVIFSVSFSCSVIPRDSLDRKQLEALDEIELASLNKANKYSLEDLSNAIEAYNNGQKYLVQGTDDISGFAYNSFIDSIEYAKRAKERAMYLYSKELTDKNTDLIEKNEFFLKSIGIHEKYSIQNYNTLIMLSNENVNLAQRNSSQLFDEINQISVLDTSRVDNPIIEYYTNNNQIFFEKGKPKIRVKQGETLIGISKTYLGSLKFWKEIYELNRANIPDPDTLRAGQKIILPELTEKVR